MKEGTLYWNEGGYRMKFRSIPIVVAALLVTSTALPYLIQPIQIQAAEYKYAKYQTDLLAQVNFERKMVGLPTVQLHPLLTKSAMNHENYLRLNGDAYAHDEIKGDKGFTGEDYASRLSAVGISESEIQGGYETITIAGNDYTALMRGMLHHAPYHRDSILSPLTEYVGFGYSKGGVVVTNALDNNDFSDSLIYNYPYNGQTNVEVGYYGNETPDPLRFTGLSKSGIISTFTPSNYYYAGSEKVTMVDSRGTKVPVILDSAGIGSLRIIPKSILEYNTTYTISASVVDEDTGRKASKKWSFTTMEDPKLNSKGLEFIDYKSRQYWSKGMIWTIDKKFLNPYTKKNSKTKRTDLYLKPFTRLTEGELVMAFTKYYYAAEYKKTKPIDPNWEYSIGYQLAKKYDLPTMATVASHNKATTIMKRGSMLRILASAHLRKPVSEQVAFDTLKKLDVVNDRSLTNFGPKSDTYRAHLATYLYRYISSK